MEGIDSIARRYKTLPSQLLGIEDEYVAMAIDLWAHNWGVQKDAHDLRERNRALTRGRRGR